MRIGPTDEVHERFMRVQAARLEQLEADAEALNHPALKRLAKEGKVILKEVNELRGQFEAAEDEEERVRLSDEIKGKCREASDNTKEVIKIMVLEIKEIN